jgi:hypothetical protein
MVSEGSEQRTTEGARISRSAGLPRHRPAFVTPFAGWSKSSRRPSNVPLRALRFWPHAAVPTLAMNPHPLTACRRPLAGHAESLLDLPRLALRVLAGPAGWTPQAPEHLEVLSIDGPDWAYLDAVEALTDQQPAHVGLRGIELGGGLRDGERTRPFHSQ